MTEKYVAKSGVFHVIVLVWTFIVMCLLTGAFGWVGLLLGLGVFGTQAVIAGVSFLRYMEKHS